MPSQRREPDRLLPADPTTRSIARELYASVQDHPIISPHGHVPAAAIADDAAFGDPAQLFISNDHYVTRLLHASGIDLSQLGVGGRDGDPRVAWRLLADHWHEYAGTASGYWIEEELSEVLGIGDPLEPENADRIFDEIGAKLATPEYRPRALFERFGIEVLATTDDPLDDLEAHRRLRDDTGFAARVLPTFRPDGYIDPDAAGFIDNVRRLVDTTARPTTVDGLLEGLAERRQHFIAHGAVSADHGVQRVETTELTAADAERRLQAVLAGESSVGDRAALRAHLLLQMARMSVEDGLVMTVHAGVHRNHSRQTFERFGPDTGHDIPVPTTFVDGLRPLLDRFGLEKGFHLILFTVDETAFSREIAPLAGFYPSVFIGAPWWFLDAPDAIARFRAATTETAGFYRGSGFIDDTRAFLSIPVRHDTARRADAAYLARLVVEGRITRAAADRIAVDLVDAIPRRAFKL